MRMIGSYRSEWTRTGHAMRIAIGLWLLSIVVFAIVSGTRSLLQRKYGGVEWAAIGLLYGVVFKVLWPFTLAAAIRRRGGSFGTWFLMGLVFGFLITGVWYLLTLRKLPVLVEFSDSATA